MPYKREGKTIYHKKAGKWEIKQVASTEENAKKTMALLSGIDSGSINPEDVGGKKKPVDYGSKKYRFSPLR